MKDMEIISPSFINNGYMPKKHTGFDADISPEFQLLNLSDDVISIAIIMDDLDIPFIKAFSHWLIWNIPKTDKIPKIYHTVRQYLRFIIQCKALLMGLIGIEVRSSQFLSGIPIDIFFAFMHLIVFEFGQPCKKKDLLEAMCGHIIQQGSITGKYKR